MPCHALRVSERVEQLTKEPCINVSGNRMCKRDLGTLHNQWRTTIIDTACLIIANLSSPADVYYYTAFATKCLTREHNGQAISGDSVLYFVPRTILLISMAIVIEV